MAEGTEESSWRLKLGVSLHCLSRPCAPEDVALLADSAVETLELSANTFDESGGVALRRALDDLFAASHVRPASVHALFGGARDISVLDEVARRRAVEDGQSAIELAGDLGADFVVVHASGEPVEDADRAARIGQCRKSLIEMAEVAQQRSVRIVVELLPRTCLGRTVEELEELLDGLDREALGVCLDTNHNMDRWAEMPGCATALDDQLWALHISDYDGVDEKHQMPGEGVLDWGAFVAALRGIDYHGPFNYEAIPPGDSFAERLSALEENFRWVCEQA